MDLDACWFYCHGPANDVSYGGGRTLTSRSREGPPGEVAKPLRGLRDQPSSNEEGLIGDSRSWANNPLLVQDSVMDTIQYLKRSTHEVPFTSDESGSRNAGPESHLFSDGSCVRRTRIQWTSALDASLLTINSSCGAPGSKGRTARLLAKWLEVHPDMRRT